MATQLHVNGPAFIYVGTSLTQLGVSVDGVTITLNYAQEDVYTDSYGPKIPFDVQYFLQDAEISCELIWYDLSVLQGWLNSLPNGGPSAGIMGSAGALYVQGTFANRLCIKSTPVNTGLTTVEPCYNFPTAFLTGSSPQHVGVKRTTWNLTWRAILNQQSTSAGATLYDQTCS